MKRFVAEIFEDGCFVEDVARAAEFEEVVGEKGRDEVRVAADDGVEQLLFEGFEMVGDVHGEYGYFSDWFVSIET